MIDAIFCNSLSRLTDRRTKSIEILNPLSDIYPIYFHDAVDWKKINLDDISKAGFTIYSQWLDKKKWGVDEKELPKPNFFWYNQPLRMGSMCNSIGHYSIWCNALSKGFSNILILEDDVRFDLTELKITLDKYESDYMKMCDIFYLGCNPITPADEIPIDSFVAEVKYTYTTHAYIVNERAMLMLRSGGLKENLITIDEYVSAFHAIHPRNDIRTMYDFSNRLVAYKTLKDVIGQTVHTEDSENWNSDTILKYE